MTHILLILLVIFLCLAALYLFLCMPGMDKKKQAFMKDGLYAHRGLYDNRAAYAENSLGAFAQAVQAGYGIELDVQLTQDNYLVVFHDKRTSRVCEKDVDVGLSTLAELKSLHLCNTAETIPLFEDVLKEIDGKVPLIVEIKYHHRLTETAKAAYRMLSAYKGAYVVESFHPLVLRWFKKNAPKIIRGQLAYGGKVRKGPEPAALNFCMKYLLLNFLSRPDFIAYDFRDDQGLSMKLMRDVFKPKLAAWTVKDKSQQAYCQKNGYTVQIFEGFTPESQ